MSAKAGSAIRGVVSCIGDLNGDNTVNTADLVTLLGNFGNTCISDYDGDGVPDSIDNCPAVYNPDQADSNGNGLGDACDIGLDSDHDGIPNDFDNCRFVFNPDQADLDNNGIGDACDSTLDNDGDGWTLGQGDCDDNDSTHHPGAFDPVGDGIDQDCDGIDG